MLLLDRLAAVCTTRLCELRQHAQRRPDGGYSTEAIAVTAFLVALALAALAIWGPKLLDKIRGMQI
ncbi:hypothetical protein Rhe02_81250 [Rhizocola hellebori]|uniref:Uncharacterized protein n=2 Tax=Rhizocola hellebori TaxID=1392758 RepID=A0A8J3QIK1_9ACTN|nr:hypothetical protein Rhe02_81250 [Rhizocola hellebori]